MARYTKTDKNHDSRLDTFIGWDFAVAYTRATEASKESDLFALLSKEDAEHFAGLAPGAFFRRGGFEYFRAW